MEPTTPYPQRWWMLTLIFLAFIELTLNWFNVVDTFGSIGSSFDIGVAAFGLITGIFLAGYGLFNIPVGLLANRYGFRKMFVLGLFVESIGALMSGASPNYPALLVFRVVSGIGGSFVVGIGFGLTSAWFKGAEINLANGVVGGSGFAIGAALALLGGVPVVDAIGWRSWLYLTGIVGLMIAGVIVLFFRAPPGQERLAGGRITRADLKEVFYNRNLWLLGISIVGSYGAYFTGSELISGYASAQLGFSASTASLVGTLFLLMGIPGSLVGGAIADRIRTIGRSYGPFALLTGLSFFLLMVDQRVTVWLVAAIAGFCWIAAFAPFSAAPATFSGVSHQNFALGVGLLLSLAAIGGFAVPTVFGLLATTSYPTGWTFLGIVSLVFLIIVLGVRQGTPPSRGT